MEPKKLTTTVELTAEDLATNDLTEVVRRRFQEAGREDFKQLAEAFQRPMTGKGLFDKAFEKANLSDGDPSSKRPMATTCKLDITMLKNDICIAYKDTNTGKQAICGNLTEFLNDLRETIGNMYIKCDNDALPSEDVRIQIEVSTVPH